MAMIGERFDIDVAFTDRGYFTMGVQDAATAECAFKREQSSTDPLQYVSMIKQDPQTFVNLLPAGVGQILAVGETLEVYSNRKIRSRNRG